MIYIGADHNGYWLKEELKGYLQRNKIPLKDIGAHARRKDDDYPDYAIKVVKKMQQGDLGVLICGSGHGMSIAANKQKGIRAANIQSVFSAKKAREEDHVNVLVLSSWELTVEKAKRIIAAWLSTRPSKSARHLRRLKKITLFEK